MKKLNSSLIVLAASAIWASCQLAGGTDNYTAPQNFRDYWYNGQAEISRYKLDQVQYGAINPGEAVLIFVTEDFRTDKQVKLESDAKDKATSVLKLNSIRRFVTGIYDYSLYSSVFTPINTKKYERSQKVTMSSQDWCGQVYTQLNLDGGKYDVMKRSYFEKDATEDFKIDAAWLEDEIWTRLRMDPQALPKGETSVIPAAYAARIAGQKLEPQKAVGTLTDYAGDAFTGKSLQQYSLNYPDAQRELRIIFDKAFPHAIAGWEETYPSRGKVLTTRAVKTEQIRSDYWSHNSPGDTTLRNELGVKGI
ncbi:hypothetical protein [Persicitalea jodogahamensis]|uniref:Septum formation inhibitor Maf n=1 Tax=Persicitalea jodogahamensis TaxID=402147 RepID=A0A8J3G780_9BACT|nr:hypothetical protein [Persicitalea jodogahamensis]GHB51750.1 hypothetical protein GCM10007390_00380 [Persicitalea jodogahamensis]